jgi:hypothetical protein
VPSLRRWCTPQLSLLVASRLNWLVDLTASIPTHSCACLRHYEILQLIIVCRIFSHMVGTTEAVLLLRATTQWGSTLWRMGFWPFATADPREPSDQTAYIASDGALTPIPTRLLLVEHFRSCLTRIRHVERHCILCLRFSARRKYMPCQCAHYSQL